MRKLIVLVFFAFVLAGCGVDTSSNPQEAGATPVDTGNEQKDVGIDYIYRNPVVADGNTNGNSTNPDNNTTPGVDPDAPVADQNNSIFDISGAVEDKFACMIGSPNEGYTNNSISDTSSDSDSKEDLEDGVLINSSFLVERTDPNSSLATLFYYDLKVQRNMVMQHVYATRYRIAVDTAWGRNNEKVVYVMTPKNAYGYYGCYRYDFSSVTDGTYSSTKVYRNNI